MKLNLLILLSIVASTQAFADGMMWSGKCAAIRPDGYSAVVTPHDDDALVVIKGGFTGKVEFNNTTAVSTFDNNATVVDFTDANDNLILHVVRTAGSTSAEAFYRGSAMNCSTFQLIQED